jgi:hypothetical protein
MNYIRAKTDIRNCVFTAKTAFIAKPATSKNPQMASLGAFPMAATDLNISICSLRFG